MSILTGTIRFMIIRICNYALSDWHLIQGGGNLKSQTLADILSYFLGASKGSDCILKLSTDKQHINHTIASFI